MKNFHLKSSPILSMAHKKRCMALRGPLQPCPVPIKSFQQAYIPENDFEPCIACELGKEL
jgi:hypothetical protein